MKKSPAPRVAVGQTPQASPKPKPLTCKDCGAKTYDAEAPCPQCGGFRLAAVLPPRAAQEDVSGKVATKLSEVTTQNVKRFRFGMPETERVFGGGIASGSSILFTGEPGIGKSTLLLQICCAVANAHPGVDGAALYITGEEDKAAIGSRARRLGVTNDSVRVLETDKISDAERAVAKYKPRLAILDSVSTMREDGAPEGAIGSVTQIKSVLARLTKACRRAGTTLLLIVHMTKEGIAGGPRALEHMVDTFAVFTGDRGAGGLRSLNTLKNRFGQAGEVAVYEMTAGGLREVIDPSANLLRERAAGVPGSVILPWAEGAKPSLVEIEVMVSGDRATDTDGVSIVRPAKLATCLGVSQSRLGRILAMLPAVENVMSGRSVDVEVRNPSRVTIEESASDLALAVATISSALEKSLPTSVVAFGEISVSGVVRRVQRSKSRMETALAAGLNHAIIPAACVMEGDVPPGVCVYPVAHIRELAKLITDISPDRIRAIRQREEEESRSE